MKDLLERLMRLRMDEGKDLAKYIKEMLQYYRSKPTLDIGISNVWTVGTGFDWWGSLGSVEKDFVTDEVHKVLHGK